jgi:hypothetical protein
MPSWGNTDSLADKPHFPEERQVRPTLTLTTANSTTGFAGKTIIFTGIGALTAANLGVVAGMSAYGANVATSGEQEFFVSNNKVVSVSTNTVTFQNTFFGTIPAGASVDFANNIVYNLEVQANVFTNTVMVSNTRIANATFGNTINHAAAHTGWVYTTTGTGGRMGRVQTEVLVALSNITTSNTLSGNTSNSRTYYAGL